MATKAGRFFRTHEPTITNSVVSVGITATSLASANENRITLVFHNMHATEIVYLGGSGVTVGSGLPLRPASEKAFTEEDALAAWWGIAGATAEVRVIATTE